tara:strand:+ start:219 stop:1100 length:882 start_codon:yes stop_codon:yes gene_type:complete
MITFYELGQLGRLGNQLFQYAALKSLGLENGYEVKIPDPEKRLWHGQKCLMSNFNIEANFISENDIKDLSHSYEEPSHEQYDKNFYTLPDGTNISGFFQSTLYFERHKNQIIKELTPKEEFIFKAEEQIRKIKEQNPGYEIVSLHMRRGDNTDNTDPNQITYNKHYGGENLTKGSAYYSYFKSATDQFKNKKVKFLIFTGGKRGKEDNSQDLLWCKKFFQGNSFLFSENRDAMEDFCLLMSCDHHILSHISSFGWWASYLDKKENITIAPLKYDPETSYNYRKGFYPKRWKLV